MKNVLKAVMGWVLCVGFASELWALNRNEARGEDAKDHFATQFVSRLRGIFAEKMGVSGDAFEIRAENLFFFPHIEEAALAKAEILDVMGLGTAGSQRPDGLFTMSLSLKFADASVREHQVSGLLSVTGPVWVTKDVINRGRVIGPEDLALIRMPWAQLATGVALTRSEDLLGRSARRLLNRGTPLMSSLFESAPSVKAGDLVELTVQSGPGVFIRSRGIAKQNGRVGDSIKVEQSDTRRPLQAVVTGEKMVEVQL